VSTDLHNCRLVLPCNNFVRYRGSSLGSGEKIGNSIEPSSRESGLSLDRVRVLIRLYGLFQVTRTVRCDCEVPRLARRVLTLALTGAWQCIDLWLFSSSIDTTLPRHSTTLNPRSVVRNRASTVALDLLSLSDSQASFAVRLRRCFKSKSPTTPPHSPSPYHLIRTPRG
jgi:hypothetical protein